MNSSYFHPINMNQFLVICCQIWYLSLSHLARRSDAKNGLSFLPVFHEFLIVLALSPSAKQSDGKTGKLTMFDHFCLSKTGGCFFQNCPVVRCFFGVSPWYHLFKELGLRHGVCLPEPQLHQQGVGDRFLFSMQKGATFVTKTGVKTQASEQTLIFTGSSMFFPSISYPSWICFNGHVPRETDFKLMSFSGHANDPKCENDFSDSPTQNDKKVT